MFLIVEGFVLADVMEAVKKPFSKGIVHYAIGMVLSWIPILNFFAIGYALDVIRKTLKGDNSLPDFDWVKNFVDAIKLIVILVILCLVPLFVVLALIGGSPLLSSFGTMNAGAIAAAFVSLGFGALIILIIAIILGVFFTASVIRFAETESIGQAFNFREVFKKAFSKAFIKSFIICFIFSLIVAILLSFYFVGALFFFWFFITGFTILASGYKTA